MKPKPWTNDEVEYLEEKWGSISIKGIAKKLNRTVNAIKLKAQRIGLDDAKTHYDGITINQLSIALNTDYATLINWIKLYDFPVKIKTFAVENRVRVVSYNDFWKWAKKNKQMLDFSRFERLSIGPEPNWVDDKRKADQLKRMNKPTPHNAPWSDGDDKKLIWMLDKYKYTYPEIATELKRSQGAIKRRMLDLGLMQRPVKLCNHNKYTAEEERTLVDMMEAGYRFDEIAAHLENGRSALGVRGKAERMGYKFKNGVPYKMSEVDHGQKEA